MSASLLAVDELSVTYGGAPAVDRISLTIDDGDCVALLGPNGAGKSSLLRAVLGLVPATGHLTLDGIDLTALPVEARVHAGIGYVPEGRRVFAGLSVRDNLEAVISAPASERARRIEEIYALFPQLAERDHDAAWQLSGGQQQMLAIGRALAQKPRLLLLDEPSLGLAPALAQEVFAVLADIAENGTALLLAEQNLRLAAMVTSRAILLDRGRVVATPTGDELRTDPPLEKHAQPVDRSSP